MQEDTETLPTSPHSPQEMGANELLAILAREGVANEAEGLLENLSKLDFFPQTEEGGPEPCPRVTTPLPLGGEAPDEMFLDPPLLTGAILEPIFVGPTLPPQEVALGKRTTGGIVAEDIHDIAPPQVSPEGLSQNGRHRYGFSPQGGLGLQLCGPDNTPERTPVGAPSGELSLTDNIMHISHGENESSLDITLISDETFPSSSESLVQVVQNELLCAPNNGHSATLGGGQSISGESRILALPNPKKHERGTPASTISEISMKRVCPGIAQSSNVHAILPDVHTPEDSPPPYFSVEQSPQNQGGGRYHPLPTLLSFWVHKCMRIFWNCVKKCKIWKKYASKVKPFWPKVSLKARILLCKNWKMVLSA